jgi:hypothetical protein
MDPRTAWQAWEPSAEQPWNRRRAAHLFRRAGFAASSSQLDEAVKAGPRAAVEQLLAIGDPQVEKFAAEFAEQGMQHDDINL